MNDTVYNRTFDLIKFIQVALCERLYYQNKSSFDENI